MNPQDPNVSSTGGAPPAEEAGSQALAEALRSSFLIVQIIMVVLVLIFLGSGFFTVGPQEQAIVLRLGKPVDGGRLLNPGLHLAWPAPIDEVVKLRITSVTNADSTVGWFLTAQERAMGAPEPPPMQKLNPANTTYALTADTNIIHLRATAHYRISDPSGFHFGFSSASTCITNALNNALLRASSEYFIDGILTSNRAAFRERVEQLVRDTVSAEHLGVTVEQIDFMPSPPLYLQSKFTEVDQAMQKSASILKQAQSYTNTTVAKALGEADTRVKIADATRKRKVDLMAAQAEIFPKLLAQYERNPELFKRIRQMAVLGGIYTNATDKWVVPRSSHELRLQLNREPQEPSVSDIPTQP